ncbi:type III-A CRISPR-associated RAMP protein Csm5 [Allomeiothermus silvanus]|uniref:type III-A CRISPR-associated RAMP protein Csm5 n=1 Tax=Allomeiothermus silvanus TaxID=52022 RepID=UPI0023F49232|nr:type III-A CRISPR-associated RAMP protein Csm5 [Allomeiothermus silvanus]
MSFLESYRLELETLGPIHVGTGEAFPAYSYLVDEAKKEALILDAGRLLELLSPEQQQNYLQAVAQGPKQAQKSLQSLWGGGLVDPTPAIVRRLPATPAFINTVKNATDAAGLEFRPLPRSPLGAYLPGSSLKGALRTAWLYYQIASKTKDILYKQEKWQFGEEVEEGLAPLIEFPQRVNPSIGQNFEKFILGHKETYDDPLRALRVSDSGPLPTRLERIGVFHPKKSTEGMVVLGEVIPENTSITLTLRYHRGLSQNWNGRRGVSASIPPDELAEACRVFYQEVGHTELDYARQNGLSTAETLYAELEQRLRGNRKAFPLRLGFGSGKLALTLALLEGRFDRKSRQLEPADNNPKTRKTAGAISPKDGFPLGWAIARLESY